MRWKRGSRALLRLPCAWLLLLLPLAAAAGLGEEVAGQAQRLHGSVVASRPAPAASGEESTPVGRGRSSSEEPSRSGRRLDEDEESRILWRGWLLVDEAPTRRKAHITPKSVFIAPLIRGEGNRGGGGIPACAEGYRSDAMGRCHKVVHVNQQAHLNFLLQRLNALYREPSPPAAPAGSPAQSDKGPLLVTIPLATNPPQNEESEEEGDDVDLVVVVEAGIPKDAPGRLGLFTGEQVASESQDDAVVGGGMPQENAEDKLMSASATDLEEMATGAGMGGEAGGDASDQDGDQMVNPQSQSQDEIGIEPVIQEDASNSTEDTNVRREVSGTNNHELPPHENLDSSSNVTSALIANEKNADKDTNAHLPNGHIYETTVIANYSTTENNGDKVTELPEFMHQQNLEYVPNVNVSDDRSEESEKRVVFPGRVEERVRFPEAEERRSPHPLLPSSTDSSVPQSSTPSLLQKTTSRPWGTWNRPMLLKFWTQMPLVREATDSPESVAKGMQPTPPPEEVPSSFARQEDSWSFPDHSDSHSKVNHGGPYHRRPWIYYQEMSPRDLASVSRVFDRVRHFESRG